MLPVSGTVKSESGSGEGVGLGGPLLPTVLVSPASLPHPVEIQSILYDQKEDTASLISTRFQRQQIASFLYKYTENTVSLSVYVTNSHQHFRGKHVIAVLKATICAQFYFTRLPSWLHANSHIHESS
jgi:uncharacterized protein YpmS